jgi:hypothetical protein
VPLSSSQCDSAFITSVRNHYGVGYGGTKTCASNNGFAERDWSTYYCNLTGQDCSYQVAGLQSCSPAGQSCSAFDGKLRVFRGRHALSGNLAYNIYGHRYRYAAVNCSQETMVMKRKRGSGDWIWTDVPARTIVIRVGGAGDPRAGAYPTLGVAYGFWKQLIPQSGSSYLMNNFYIYATQSQGGFACADVQRRFETFDITPLSCNYNLAFCSPGQSCSGACWK